MKAIGYTHYGPPEVLRLQEIPQPVPRRHEVLIRLYASTVTPSDGLMRSGKSPLGRLISGLRRPREKFQVLGIEFAGEIVATGKDVRRFRTGDPVYGFRGFGTGAYAEYKCMPENASLALKPANASYEEAAALVDGATTALFFLRDKGKIQAGQNALIYGASGSIGTAAVQLAKTFGARVSGVCSTANIDLVKSLGADTVIDYTQTDFTQNGQTYDLIFDTVGKTSFSRCQGSLSENGRYLVTTGGMLKNAVLTLWTAIASRKKMIWALSIDKREALVFIRALVEAGKLKPVIDRCYPLEQVAAAHHYVEKGHKKGNVVLQIGNGATGSGL